jgi:TonB family protein
MMAFRKFWFLAVMAALPALCFASVFTAPRNVGGRSSLTEREHRIWNSAVHDSVFAALVHSTNRSGCGAVQPPQALATPDPLLEEAESNSKVSVSFIIGTDGLVHSPLILESAGPSEDRTVLAAVRFWRYRPALCNGVPTDAEAKVEFSSR